MNKKRSASDNQTPPSQFSRVTGSSARSYELPTCFRAGIHSEQEDLNNSDWELQKLHKPAELFASIQDQWKVKTQTNPHQNRTFRFSPTTLRTRFTLPGSNNNHIDSGIVYDNQIKLINNSMQKIHAETVSLQQTLKNDKKYGRARVNYLKNYRNQLNNKLRKLNNAKVSARSLYSFYYDPVAGRNANIISTKQKSEAEHVVGIINTLTSFYGYPK